MNSNPLNDFFLISSLKGFIAYHGFCVPEPFIFISRLIHCISLSPFSSMGLYSLPSFSCLRISACRLYQICTLSWLGIIFSVHIFFPSELSRPSDILILTVAIGRMKTVWVFSPLKEVLVGFTIFIINPFGGKSFFWMLEKVLSFKFSSWTRQCLSVKRWWNTVHYFNL